MHLRKSAFTPFFASIAMSLLVATSAIGETHNNQTCIGSLYRSKKVGVVVYRDPDTSSEIIRRLELGEKVCYIGEKDSFAIILSGEIEQSNKTPQTVYIRLVDLWPPRDAQTSGHSGGLLQDIKRQVDYMKAGGVRESGLLPSPFDAGEKNNSDSPAAQECGPGKDCEIDQSAVPSGSSPPSSTPGQLPKTP